MSQDKHENMAAENTPNYESKKKLPELKLNKEWVNKSLPAILVLSTLAILYIYIANLNVRMLNEAEKLKIENQELRSELIAIQTDLMTKSKQSEVSKKIINEFA
jgi:hypothetical protein